jgi:hypothetical protein
MLSFNKDFLMSKFKFVEFPTDLFCKDISQDEEIVHLNNYIPQLCNLHLSTCFVPHEENLIHHMNHGINTFSAENTLGATQSTSRTAGSHSPPGFKVHKKSIDIVKGTSWRKHSECEKKSDSFKETHEVEIKILPGINGNFSRRNSGEVENISEAQEGDFQIKNNDTNKLNQILSLVKITKKKSKKIHIKIIFVINQKLQVNNDLPIWYLNIKKGIAINDDLLLGPFSSNQIVEFYEMNLLNEFSEIRLYLDFEQGGNVKDKEILEMHGKDFKVKDMSKCFNLQEPVKKENPKKRKFSSNHEEMYFNNSLYNIVMTNHTTPTNKKGQGTIYTDNKENSPQNKNNEYQGMQGHFQSNPSGKKRKVTYNPTHNPKYNQGELNYVDDQSNQHKKNNSKKYNNYNDNYFYEMVNKK